MKVGGAEKDSSGPGSVLTHRLEVEGDHLATSIPKHLGHVVGGVHAGSLGINAAHLALVVAAPEYRMPRLPAPGGPNSTHPWSVSTVPLPPPQPGTQANEDSRILHKLHCGLREQIISLELCE